MQNFPYLSFEKRQLRMLEGHQTGVNRRRFALYAAAGCLYFAIPVFGHAILLASTPGFKAVVHGPNVPIQLRFNSRIDQKRSSLTLIGPDGAQRSLAVLTGGSPEVLASEANNMGKGAYVLQWQVLAADGHITRGEVRFSVD